MTEEEILRDEIECLQDKIEELNDEISRLEIRESNLEYELREEEDERWKLEQQLELASEPDPEETLYDLQKRDILEDLMSLDLSTIEKIGKQYLDL